MAPVSGTIRLVPKPAAPPRANWITYGGATYRGEGEVKVSLKGRLTFVNTVNLEEYLLGVVPNEMSPSWAAEALKAQAVAARTYSLANLSGYPAEFFDMTDTTADQAYGGVKIEHPNSNTAVQATSGEVVRYNGQLITTFYSASTGGHTESVEIVWGGPQPYLVGVEDYDNLPGNKNYAWTDPFTVADLKARLATANINVGDITAIKPEGAPGPGGHPPKWKVVGTKGEAVITGPRLRSVLGLLAAPRSVKLLDATGAVVTSGTTASASPAAASLATISAPQTVKVLGADGRTVERQVAGAVVQGADGRTTTLSGVATAVGADGNQVAFQPPAPAPTPTPTPTPGPGPVATIEFDGGGWGHGIGMSQWGAYGMALQGKTYVQILTHYYTGTKVEKP
jgi:stage II sporulation protein D